MKSFKDTAGRGWEISVTVGTVRRVKNATGIDLTALFGDDAAKFFGDVAKVAEVIYVICEDQMKAKTVIDPATGNERLMTEEDFANAMNGDTMEAASNALLEAVIDFFPQSRQPIFRKMIDKSRLMTDAATAKLMEQIDALDVTNFLASKNKSSN